MIFTYYHSNKDREQLKVKRIRWSLVMFGLGLFFGVIVPNNELSGKDSSFYSESIFVHTDREYYIAGEAIQFKAYLKSPGKSSVKSRIIYLELLDTDGKKMQEHAYFVEQGKAYGNFQLPDSLNTGSFILNAYTNWHKNFEYKKAFSKELIIINRFGRSEEVVYESASTNINTVKISSNPNPFTSIIKASLDSKFYSRRSEGILNIEIPESNTEFSMAELSVSIYPVPEHFSQSTPVITDWISTPDKDNTLTARNKNQALLHPVESAGKVVSGKVIDRSNGKLVSDALVIFSFSDTVPYLDYDRTDSAGNFYINIPLGIQINPGYLQIWETPENSGPCEIFFPESISRPNITLNNNQNITGDELSGLFVEQIKIFQVENIFKQTAIVNKRDQELFDLVPFYSGLGISIDPVNYVRLKNFSEIAREILPGVRVRDENEGISIRIMDETRNTYFDTDPLVLLNGLPLKNYNSIANLNSDDIREVYIVRRLFAIGDIIFPGLLSIKLKTSAEKELFDEIQLYPVHSEVLSGYSTSINPDYSSGDQIRSRRPDFRNTLSWYPDVQIKDTHTRLSFVTGDISGSYVVCIQGLINDELPVYLMEEFIVESK